MSYLKFDKTRLVNLEYSLPKEILMANSLGVYCNSTIVGCNTRKYHGLLVVPVREIDGGRHVLLSNLHETVIQHQQEFNLGITKYPGEYSPKGHKYARWFESDPAIKMVYRVGGVVLQKELILDEEEARLSIQYTLLEANSPTKLRLKPFLAFRSIHALSHANLYANFRSYPISNGIKSRLYQNYPDVFMQISKKNQFITAPDWYYQVTYSKEKVRGYDFHEDLFVPGYFDLSIKKGESIVFTAGLNQMPPNQIKKKFRKVLDSIPEVTNFEQVLAKTAGKFIQLRDGKPEIIAGFPWFGRWGRFPLIAIPGLLLTKEKYSLAAEILENLAGKLKDGLFPDHSMDITKPNYGAVDTSLWYIWAVQKLFDAAPMDQEMKEKFVRVIKRIIESYLNGKIEGLRIEPNGLLYAHIPNKALTWMDSYIDGQPVTQRAGYAVEVNALWYNAIVFSMEIGAFSLPSKKGKMLSQWIDTFPADFSAVFWNEDSSELADCVFEGVASWDVRPNITIAAAMPYSPLNDDQKMAVLDVVNKELLTPRGLRTLSPRSIGFKHSYEGDHQKRDLAYHQGTVWPWLLGFYAEAWLNLYEGSGRESIERLVQGFEEDLIEHGIGNISEVYDGSPPYRPCGAISFAASVAELMRIQKMLE